MKRKFWYSNMKEEDYNESGIIYLLNLGITDVIIDFDIMSNKLPQLLLANNIIPWLRMKMYEQPIMNPEWFETNVKNFLEVCKVYGCRPAFDCEAYSGSMVWYELGQVDLAARIIRDHLPDYGFSEVVLYPEMFQNDWRYRFYMVFIFLLSAYCKKIHVMHELTYHRVLPWELKSCFDENDKLLHIYKENPNNEIISYCGIWPMSQKWFGCLQKKFADDNFENIFYYTEEKTLL